MVTAFLLGLTGSVGHCVGMCSGVTVILGRRGVTRGWRLLLAHLGRITTYALLGVAVGTLGHSVMAMAPESGAHHPANAGHSAVAWVQGILALGAAGLAVYMALALLGRVKSPEVYLSSLTGRWGRAMRRLNAEEGGKVGLLEPYALGLLWGLLPCGLVLVALLTAAVSHSPWQGGLKMLAFGFGTWPALIGVGWMARANLPSAVRQLRPAAALVVLLFGVQMALRGLAAWGWVEHAQVAGVMLW